MTADSGEAELSSETGDVGGAATPRQNENSANDLPAFTEKQLKAATKIEVVSRGHAAPTAVRESETGDVGRSRHSEAEREQRE